MFERHGEAGRPQTLEYRSWAGMIQRCTNPNNPKYSCYGARGITVCYRWRSAYVAFLMDMGRRPTPKHTLDRRDNSAGYCPDNCLWSTREEQSRNRRSNKLDVSKVKEIRRLFSTGTPQKELSKKYGITLDVIHKVVRNKTWKNI